MIILDCSRLWAEHDCFITYIMCDCYKNIDS